MIKRSTIRYAAKQAYQLAITHGKYGSMQCGLQCQVEPCVGIVRLYEYDGQELTDIHEVPIAKAWANL
jgi:hypothetical protein